MDWKPLNKEDTSLYKGIAILMIVTHNFMHLFPTPKQNEFEFHADRFISLLNLLRYETENSLQFILSFFGHFGVQIFVFLSAYGLTKKYLLQQPKYWSFIWQRIIKIYPMFLLAIIIWAFITGWSDYGLLGPLKMMYWFLDSLIFKLILISNFIPDEELIPVGSWWFIPFIFQFYFIFPFLLKLYSRWGSIALIVLSTLSISFAMIVNGKIAGVNIYFTILGHIPEFCLGLYLAKSDSNRMQIPGGIFVIALTVFLLGNIYETLWHVNHLSFLIILLMIFNVLNPAIKNSGTGKAMLLFFGSISMPLFLVNDFLHQPFYLLIRGDSTWYLSILMCFISLVTAVVVSMFLLKAEKKLTPLIIKLTERK